MIKLWPLTALFRLSAAFLADTVPVKPQGHFYPELY
jgi:hypothetical protein